MASLVDEQEDQLQASAFATVDPFEIRTPSGTSVRAKVVDIYDSDTLHVNLFLPGTGLTRLHLRLRRVNGPEIRSPRLVEKRAGVAARDALLAFVVGGAPSIRKARLRTPDVRTVLALCPQPRVRVALGGTDKFGRVLAELWNDGRNAADWMLAQGLVLPFCNRSRAKPTFSDAHMQEIVAKHGDGVFVGNVDNMDRVCYEADAGESRGASLPTTVEHI